MRKALLVMIAAALFLSPSVMAQDRSGTFVLVHVDWYLGPMWLNVDHMHRIYPCSISRDPDALIQACIMMADHVPGSINRDYRVEGPYEQAVRHVLNLPNPTTPSGSVSGPVTATVGEPVTLTATVVDPDYGESWTYNWAESSATRNGGVFSAPVGRVTDYTPAMAGTVIIWLQITDSAGQRSSSISHQIVVAAAGD